MKNPEKLGNRTVKTNDIDFSKHDRAIADYCLRSVENSDLAWDLLYAKHRRLLVAKLRRELDIPTNKMTINAILRALNEVRKEGTIDVAYKSIGIPDIYYLPDDNRFLIINHSTGEAPAAMNAILVQDIMDYDTISTHAEITNQIESALGLF